MKREATAAQTCLQLQSQYPSKVALPNTTEYIYENSEYWNVLNSLSPACIVNPSSADDVSAFVKTFTGAEIPFAVRGGGHMTALDSNNINSTGILISADNLTSLALSDDKQTLSVGPGNRWVDVYQYLSPYGIAVPGGRIGIVGVPGLLLGGGMSYFSGQYGFSSTSVKAYEVVLANGEIVTATANNSFSDLHWALKGGGNSFGIVTRFDLQTHPAPYTYIGMNAYNPLEISQWLDAIYNFATYGQTEYPEAAVIPFSNYIPNLSPVPVPTTIVFYDSKTPLGGVNATALQNFSAPRLTPLTSTYVKRDMYAWSQELDPASSALKGDRQRFHALTAFNSPDTVQTIHNTFMAVAEQMISIVTGVEAALAIMPVSKNWVEQSNAGAGDPMGLDESKAPYIFVEQSLTWGLPVDDATIENFVTVVNQQLNAVLDAKGLKSSFLYLNDADGGQPVFQGYKPENVAKLKAIREKYDPKRIYTDLMPGGWKVADVES
ncbi:FAD-binding domain-containing protein [Viridothelium virens]|uniref:FAD-binding domain-containing protein n=1 Tax=Viridothelium virens TaxID=1048519 RepID=A0A6A6H0G6_VIRVR|nr:FAD-binding domain-containing protein [Viridothelium virens]